jgi:hypothetical protein
MKAYYIPKNSYLIFDDMVKNGSAKRSRRASGFLRDNDGCLMLVDDTKQKWLDATAKHQLRWNGNVAGTLGRGFYINMNWLVKFGPVKCLVEAA